MKKVFGLVGPIASGKGTVAGILTDLGFSSYSLSDRVREEVKKRGLELTRENQQLTGNALREEFGSDILAKRTAEIIDNNPSENIVIDAIRNPKEIEFLKEKYGIKIIALKVNQERRYELLKQRGNQWDTLSWEEFKLLDDRELAQTGKHKQQVNETVKMADIVIENDGTIEELKEKIKDIA